MISIKSIPRTSRLKCAGGCSSWIAHWEKAKKRSAHGCLVSGCWKKATVCAHVKVVGESQAYVIPMCDDHNTSTEAMLLNDSQRLSMVPAEKLDSCNSAPSIKGDATNDS
jgi:hypothetical protein